MEKLKKYIRKNLIRGLTYVSFPCGNDYFYNVKAPVYEMLVLTLEYKGLPPEARQAAEKAQNKIIRYCNRYGYEIIGTINYIPGESRIEIARRDDHNKYIDYNYYVKESVKDCEILRHIYGNYKNLDRDLKTIMSNYESAYLQFLQDQETGKTA